MQKMLKMDHHMDDYECMWNGIEDIYIEKTGYKIPNSFFFMLSGYGNIIYLKGKQLEFPIMPCFSDGRTKKMYEFLHEIVGFNYHIIENRSFEFTMKKAYAEIDQGYPVVLGPLDMGNLAYLPKFYHRYSIPIHYILMIGYDDNGIYAFDCGREETVYVSNSDIKDALDIVPTIIGGKNALCQIRMDTTKTPEEIFKAAILSKAEAFLNPPVKSIGWKGLENISKEFLQWETMVNSDDYQKCLRRMIEFFGTVPNLPNRLKGIPYPDFCTYDACRYRMEEVVAFFGFNEAANLFHQSGMVIENITNIIVDYLTNTKDERKLIPDLVLKVKEYEKQAYLLLKEHYHE